MNFAGSTTLEDRADVSRHPNCPSWKKDVKDEISIVVGLLAISAGSEHPASFTIVSKVAGQSNSLNVGAFVSDGSGASLNRAAAFFGIRTSMRSLRTGLTAFAFGLLSCGLPLACAPSAEAADRIVAMDRRFKLAPNVDALPRILGPVDGPERKINAALARLDNNVKKAIADCKAQDADRNDSFWTRGADVLMRGPRFISFVITDNAFCGGAHPDISTMSIVYDLTSGSPVDWTTLLSPALTGNPELSTGMDGTKMITLSGKALKQLYLAGYSAARGESQGDDCKRAVEDALRSEGSPGFMVWIDAKREGLVAQFDLSHSEQACSEPVVVSLSALRGAGAQLTLVRAIEAAHSSMIPR